MVFKHLFRTAGPAYEWGKNSVRSGVFIILTSGVAFFSHHGVKDLIESSEESMDKSAAERGVGS